MPLYRYKARDQQAKLIEGVMSGDSENAVAQKLKQTGYLPVLITVTQSESGQLSHAFDRFQSVKFSDINVFTRQLYTLQKAGLTLLASLNAVKEQANNQHFKTIIEQMIRDIEGGSSLSAAMTQHPKIFNPIYVNMIKAGEISGKLAEILERLAVLGEHDEKIRLKISAAVRYPLMVVCSIVIGFGVLVTVVIPKFSQLFLKFKTDLPVPTKILIFIHHAVVYYWWLVILIAIGVYFLFRNFVRTERGSYVWDGFKLSVPVFGPLLLNLIMSRFCRITGILLRSGIPILQILDLVAQGVGNAVVAKIIQDIKGHVNEGKGMLLPMKQSKLFPPLVTQMVAVGEETGRLDELLIHASDYYDSQVEYTISNLIVLIEPFLIFFLGIAVLLMALGIFTPMWNLMNLFKH